MRYVTCCTILLKPNIIYINTIKRKYKKNPWFIGIIIFSNGVPQQMVQRCQIAASWRLIKRLLNVWGNKSIVAWGISQICIILLKPNIVHVNTMKTGYKTTGCHGVLAISIDRNDSAVLIFKENYLCFANKFQIYLNVLVQG